MKFVIQRVKQASVKVEGSVIGEIEKGYLVLIGVSDKDTEAVADKMIKKMIGLRIFEDAEGKTNLSLADVWAEVFCLYHSLRFMQIVKRGIGRVLLRQGRRIKQISYMSI